MTDSPIPTKSTILGRYLIKAQLGEGIFGSVYLAEDKSRVGILPTADIAVKIIYPELAKELGGLAELAPYLSAACRINHPNIVNVFDFHESDGRIIVLMEKLVGKTLRKLMNEDSTEKHRLSLIRQYAEGLSYAHQSSAYLRLNPSKLWVQDDGRLKIADLGLAFHLDPALWADSAIERREGMYLAPEILQGTSLPDQRADQFSFAVVAHEILTGSSAIRNDQSIATLRKSYAVAQVESIQRALAPEPTERFNDTQALVAPFAAIQSSGKTQWRSSLARRHLPLIATLLLASVLAGAVWWASLKDSSAPTDKGGQRTWSQLEELFHRVDDRRMELYSLGLHRGSFAEGIRRYANARKELQWMATLTQSDNALRSESTRMEALNSIEAIKRALEARRRAFCRAHDTILAVDELDECKEISKRVGYSLPAILVDVAALETARQSVINTFTSGLFEQSADEAAGARDRFYKALETKTADLVESTETAQTQWTVLGTDLGRPVIEPLGEPSQRLAEAIEFFATHQWGEGIAAINKAMSIWIRWTQELKAMPKKLEQETENVLGMRFRMVGDLAVSIWETRVIDFLAFIRESGIDPSRQWREFAFKTNQGPTHPAAFVNHHDAVRFCQWLTEVERKANRIGKYQRYRLPTDREWSLAVGLPIEIGATPGVRLTENMDDYPWGKEAVKRSDLGNYDTHPNRDDSDHLRALQDQFLWTSPVGSFAANAQGLYDMGGNVFEWVSDRWGTHDDPAKHGAIGLDSKVVRGGSWRTLSLHNRLSSFRQPQRYGNEDTGFRIVLTNDALGAELSN